MNDDIASTELNPQRNALVAELIRERLSVEARAFLVNLAFYVCGLGVLGESYEIAARRFVRSGSVFWAPFQSSFREAAGLTEAVRSKEVGATIQEATPVDPTSGAPVVCNDDTVLAVLTYYASYLFEVYALYNSTLDQDIRSEQFLATLPHRQMFMFLMDLQKEHFPQSLRTSHTSS